MEKEKKIPQNISTVVSLLLFFITKLQLAGLVASFLSGIIVLLFRKKRDIAVSVQFEQ